MVKEGGRTGGGNGRRWWTDWASDEGEDEALEPTSLWEAGISALDDDQLRLLVGGVDEE